MNTLVGLLAYLLIGLAVAPLLVLGLYMLADRLGLRIAERLLDALLPLLTLQWLGGGLLNIVGGLAIGALGVWAVMHDGGLVGWGAGALLVPFGLWRTLRGVGVTRAFMAPQDPP
ncbi:hypothetical protein [Variovorax guangxiensis]|uniref:hypothetical protein n=1 Tax=Variovorax guangxiensis TaxID=1775474 RepID=UPI001128F0B7|nr:hypothetical protein [Variovorax guangxiensis]RZI69236.1 MAG: hypothetical protein EOP79_02590 [Variovorax sp.]